MTDDEAQLQTELRKLDEARTKLFKAETPADFSFYSACVAGWERSVAALRARVEREKEKQR